MYNLPNSRVHSRFKLHTFEERFNRFLKRPENQYGQVASKNNTVASKKCNAKDQVTQCCLYFIVATLHSTSPPPQYVYKEQRGAEKSRGPIRDGGPNQIKGGQSELGAQRWGHSQKQRYGVQQGQPTFLLGQGR